jgi:hypothetical protein
MTPAESHSVSFNLPSTIISADSGANKNKSINFLTILNALHSTGVNLKKD